MKLSRFSVNTKYSGIFCFRKDTEIFPLQSRLEERGIIEDLGYRKVNLEDGDGF